MLICVQALAVWKMARRERLLSAKITRLAGTPCSYEPVSVQFTVDNSNDAGELCMVDAQRGGTGDGQGKPLN